VPVMSQTRWDPRAHSAMPPCQCLPKMLCTGFMKKIRLKPLFSA
jgi:hypothetical protein